jgi:hypothetical protein
MTQAAHIQEYMNHNWLLACYTDATLNKNGHDTEELDLKV